MTALRSFLSRHRWLAASIIAAALLMRVLVPAGYMTVRTAGGITLELCGGIAAPAASMAMPGMHHGGGKPEGHAQPEVPCAFAALSAPSLAAADPLIRASLIAFVFAVVFLPAVRRSILSPPFLRPPLRGPPAIA